MKYEISWKVISFCWSLHNKAIDLLCWPKVTKYDQKLPALTNFWKFSENQFLWWNFSLKISWKFSVKKRLKIFRDNANCATYLFLALDFVAPRKEIWKKKNLHTTRSEFQSATYKLALLIATYWSTPPPYLDPPGPQGSNYGGVNYKGGLKFRRLIIPCDLLEALMSKKHW